MSESSEESKGLKWPWEKRMLTGRWIKIGYATIRREMESMLRPIGVTHTQWSALGAIALLPGLTHSDLEKILQIERPSVTSLVKGMEKNGWIIRKEHPHDARFKQIYLTEAGKKLAEETKHFGEVVDEKILQVLSQSEADTLRHLLQKLAKGMDPSISEPPRE